MNKSLVITEYNDRIVALAFSGRKLQYLNVSECDDSILGNIYVGKVKNVVTSINACFVEYQKDLLCFVPLNSIKAANILNSQKDIPVAGDEILIQISANAKGEKNPTATGSIKINDRKIKLDNSNPLYTQAKQMQCFSLIRQADPDYIRFILETSKLGFTSLLTDKEDIYNILVSNLDLIEKIVYETEEGPLKKPRKQEIKAINQEKNLALRLYNDDSFSLSALYGLNAVMEEVFSKKVWLKSGGYLIIEPTEALVSIDVNSGKDTSKRFSNENILRINTEAAVEVARQIRLRNYSGIIIVDFINMKSDEDKEILIDTIKNELSKDIIRAEFVEITLLGLAEITRKRTKSPINMQFIK